MGDDVRRWCCSGQVTEVAEKRSAVMCYKHRSGTRKSRAAVSDSDSDSAVHCFERSAKSHQSPPYCGLVPVLIRSGYYLREFQTICHP